MPPRLDQSPNRQRTRRRLGHVLLVAAAIIIALVDFRRGSVVLRLLPLPPVDISQPAPWFLDARLSALQHDKAQCAAVLKGPIIESAPIPDQPYKAGCGWQNAVRITAAAGAKVSDVTVTCEVAAAFAMWMQHSVQIAAQAHFGSSVTSVQTLGTYACRNIVGNKLWQDFRSQHATANAIDVSGFTLENGQTVTIKKDWRGDTPNARFLRDIHSSACRYFRVVLSPDYNSAHSDHFHADRGFLKACK